VKGRFMQTAIQELTERVEESKQVASSAIIFIEGLAEQLTTDKDDPQALQALAIELGRSSTLLAQAITDNTEFEGPGEVAADATLRDEAPGKIITEDKSTTFYS
jgi:predicted transcriptional regulator